MANRTKRQLIILATVLTLNIATVYYFKLDGWEAFANGFGWGVIAVIVDRYLRNKYE